MWQSERRMFLTVSMPIIRHATDTDRYMYNADIKHMNLQQETIKHINSSLVQPTYESRPCSTMQESIIEIEIEIDKGSLAMSISNTISIVDKIDRGCSNAA
jgi:hypothetical protein